MSILFSDIFNIFIGLHNQAQNIKAYCTIDTNAVTKQNLPV